MASNTSLLALTCGDSYGAPYEKEGLAGVRFNIEDLPDRIIKPLVTDDTKMSMILLKHYKRYKTLHVESLLQEYKTWAKEDGLQDGIGIHTREILMQNKTDKNSQGNGALMRVLPFGVQLIKDGYGFEEAVRLMNADSAITHDNETIFMANKLALDIALSGLNVLEKPIYRKIITKLHLGSSAWVIHSLYIVIEALKKDLSFLEGFKYIVSYGGDTDTNCAIYGAIKGAKEDIRDSMKVEEFLM